MNGGRKKAALFIPTRRHESLSQVSLRNVDCCELREWGEITFMLYYVIMIMMIVESK